MATVVDKENQANVADVAADKKMPAGKKQTAKDASENLSPYDRRIQEMKASLDAARAAHRQAKGSDKDLPMLQHTYDIDSLWKRYSIAERMGDDCDTELEELEESEVKKGLGMLTQKEVDESIFAMILPRSCFELEDTLRDDLYYADPRNGPRGSGMISLNTYSSFCMYPVIKNHFALASKEVNKAEKAVKAASKAGAAKEALVKTVAAVMACHSVDHWRHDTEEPEEVVKYAKKCVEVVKKLLWFTDAELGWTDPYSRKALLHYLRNLAIDWMDTADSLDYENFKKMNFETAKNGKGLGRPLTMAAGLADTNPAPTKKAKTFAAAAPAAASQSTGTATLTTYFDGLQSKLNDRVKTLCQLKITNLSNTKKVEHVVLSGASDMKKVHQLVAYLAGVNPNFQYHSQKGSYTKGCYFVLETPGYKPCWIAPPDVCKTAAKAGTDAVLDKSIKIVQVFQALNCGRNDAFLYDSDLARTIVTSSSALTFVTASGERYAIQPTVIAPTKCSRSKAIAMPRIVTYDENQRKSAFGLTLTQAKAVMQGDRQDNQNFIVCVTTTAAEVKKYCFNFWKKPICEMDGSGIFASRFGLGKSEWDVKHVQSAGPPDGYAASK
ncbi:expressed unknown protein [Seminavis robusta]|uniref:Uncharacterized protein n=1 Tax=Seminavis robusta TaxID=568900 RepID=A0A9N8H841_9STRA|nr:expressed unknown protein [Seminavis robusta]|eukprot:Sro204_g085750.1 n/a (610) ;mRNA; r:4502-6428